MAVPDIELPADLVDLQKRILAAFAAESAHNRAVEARQRDLYPDPEQIVERRTTWPAEDRAESERLRAEGLRLALEKADHPFMLQARTDGTLVDVEKALRKAAQAGQSA